MDKPIRAFIAIELNERTRAELVRVQDKLRSSNADVKWVEAKNIHLTLKFLEDIASKDIDQAATAMINATAGIKAFPLEIGELGAFPDILFPKVVWAGVTSNSDLLKKIVEKLDENLKKFKIKKEEHPFTAHITLGRTRTFRGKDQLVGMLEETYLPAGLTQTVDHLTLYESKLTPQGPVYSILSQVQLQ